MNRNRSAIPSRDSIPLSEIARHEASHVIVEAVLTGWSSALVKIDRRELSGGAALSRSRTGLRVAEEHGVATASQARTALVIIQAGPASDIVFGQHLCDPEEDILSEGTDTYVADQIARRYGLDLDELLAEAVDLVIENAPAIDRLANRIFREGSMSGDRLAGAVRRALGDRSIRASYYRKPSNRVQMSKMPSAEDFVDYVAPELLEAARRAQ